MLLPLTGFANPKDEVNTRLDKFHLAAAQADWQGYFSLYTDDAIFIGTDASETWTLDELKHYAKPAFDSGKGWTYVPIERHIYFSKDNTLAWFDEMLSHEKLGLTRGTGVLELSDNGQWKIAQYHLVMPIPNALIKDVAEQIKTFEKANK
jgi:ketosteroid isomerase-like protein